MSNDHDIVIVVDDDLSVRISLARLLASANLPYKIFASAEDFLANVERDASGYAIVDVHLPGMNGLDLQKIIAQQYTDLSVAIITAFEDAETERRARAAGAVAFLYKLFDPNELLDILKTTRKKSM